MGCEKPSRNFLTLLVYKRFSKKTYAVWMRAVPGRVLFIIEGEDGIVLISIFWKKRLTFNKDVRNFGSKDIIGASNPGLYHDHENNQYQHETQIS